MAKRIVKELSNLITKHFKEIAQTSNNNTDPLYSSIFNTNISQEENNNNNWKSLVDHRGSAKRATNGQLFPLRFIPATLKIHFSSMN